MQVPAYMMTVAIWKIRFEECWKTKEIIMSAIMEKTMKVGIKQQSE